MTYEVIRTHAATGRVQVVVWTPMRDVATREAASANRMQARTGKTLATSGHLETGWVYSVREAKP